MVPSSYLGVEGVHPYLVVVGEGVHPCLEVVEEVEVHPFQEVVVVEGAHPCLEEVEVEVVPPCLVEVVEGVGEEVHLSQGVVVEGVHHHS